MSKVKIKLKLQGLELEIEGERADIPTITHGLQKHISGLIQAPAAVISNTPATLEAQTERLLPADNGEKKQRKPRRQPGEKSETVIDFKHDADKWGSPSQEWTTKEKAMWLLYVVEQQLGPKELSYDTITATFNKYFRQAGAIHRANVWRDLGKAKLAPALVGEDVTKSPSVWYLTIEGKKAVELLISGLPKSTTA